jgi:hypothetical protein
MTREEEQTGVGSMSEEDDDQPSKFDRRGLRHFNREECPATHKQAAGTASMWRTAINDGLGDEPR